MAYNLGFSGVQDSYPQTGGPDPFPQGGRTTVENISHYGGYPQTGGPDPFPQGGRTTVENISHYIGYPQTGGPEFYATQRAPALISEETDHSPFMNPGEWAGTGAPAAPVPLSKYKDVAGNYIPQSTIDRQQNYASGGSLYQADQDQEAAMRARVAAMRANAPAGVGVVGIDGNAFYGMGSPSSGGASGGSTPFGGVQNTPQQAQTGPAAGGGNPYLQQQADAITNQVNQNWTRVQQPSIRSGAMAAGGFGGSRQGVVEANALNDINQGLSNSLANLYGADWTNAQNRGLQQQQITNSYNLGLGNLALGNESLNANIYNSNFANQMASANFGLNAYNTMMGYGQQGINGATTIQNTPLQYQQYFNNAYNAGGGQGGTSTSVQGTTSNPWMTASTAVRALGY